MNLNWVETAKGKALRIEVNDYHASFYPFELEHPNRVASIAAISFWEGIAGLPPRGRITHWRWRRGLRKLQTKIEKEVRLATTE